MATLKTLLTAEQISTLIANAPTNTPTSTNISTKAWELLYDTATELGQRLNDKFWQAVDADNDCFVCFKGKSTREILSTQYNKIFARHLGELLRQGYKIVWVKKCVLINWKNWKSTYSKLTSQPDAHIHEYDPETTRSQQRTIAIENRKMRDFYDLAKPIRSKKNGKMRISFEEAHSQRVRAERESFESKVISRAEKILAAI